MLTKALSAIVVLMAITRKMASLFCSSGTLLDGVPGVGSGSIFFKSEISSSTVVR